MLVRGHGILDFAISSLLRRKVKNIIIFATFSIIIFFLSTIILITDALIIEARTGMKFAPDVLVQGTRTGRQELIPKNWIGKIGAIRGVKEVRERFWGYYYDSISRANYTLVGIEDRDLIKDLGLFLEKGEMIKEKWDVLVGRGIVDQDNLKIGSEIFFYGPDRKPYNFKVKGIFRGSTDLWTRDILVMRETSLRELFQVENNLTVDLWVYVYNDDEASNIAAKINSFIPGVRCISKKELQRTYEAAFGWRSGVMIVMFFASILAFIILASDKATSLSAEEKREIGILKAIGWQTSDILKLKFYESAIISVLSYLLGFIMSFVNVTFFGASIFRPIMTGWSVIYPAFQLSPVINLNQLFLIFFISVLPYIASTIIPSWRTSVIDPDIVIRGL